MIKNKHADILCVYTLNLVEGETFDPNNNFQSINSLSLFVGDRYMFL